ncbi:MAG: transporter [Alphaproteobacteria bacterium]|nr:transporter [Alphaproteobacteria bacterium]MBV8411747.1 transporter [Alphaproteobacteria bacterium]
MHNSTGARAVYALLATTACAVSADAREPGVGQVVTPGITLGQANAVPLTPGFRLASRTTYNDATALGPDSAPTGLRQYSTAELVLLTWVPDWKVLAADYKIFTVLPFATSTLVRDAPVAKPARGTFFETGMGNPKLQFVDLSWTLGEGFYASAGFGVYFPIGQWSSTSPVNIGAPYWTFEPTAAFSYYKDGWTASMQGFYDTNTINPTTNYYSGDVIVLNATLMKMFGGVNVGPVGYWLKQVTADANYGTSVLAGQTALPGQQLAVGGTVSTQFGNLSVQLMFTTDVYAPNAFQGSKGWLSLSYHFK